MTLKELSAQYEASAQLLRGRLRELRILYAKTDDPDEKWRIKRRIAELTPMLTQMNELSWLLEHYYTVGGGDHDDRYGFNGKRIRRKNKVSKKDAKPHCPERTYGEPAPDIFGIPYQGNDNSPDSRSKRRTQKHRKSYAAKGRAENPPDYSISLSDDALLDRFFTQKQRGEFQ